MKEYISTLMNTQLFSGVGEDEIVPLLGCLNARLRTCKKGEYIFRQGEKIGDITVLVEGQLHIQRDDYWGNSNIISSVSVGEMFGEAYVAPDSGTLANNVIAIKDSTVIFFDAQKIISTCPCACNYHTAVVKNLVFAISDKNRKLVRKLGHMAHRTTREKLMSYLSEESARRGSPSFVIEFNRQQLADYLSVDRSAMSNELCKMRDEGLIEFDKSNFTLI